MLHKSGIINGKRVHQTPLRRPDLLDNATDVEYQISSLWKPKSNRHSVECGGEMSEGPQQGTNPARLGDTVYRLARWTR